MNSDNKYLRFACVIQCLKNDYSINLEDSLKRLSSLFICKYYCIIHNRDIKESGELKNKHIHLVITFNQRIRLKTAINRVAESFKIEDFSAISIERVNDMTMCLQYLIHKNNPEKTPYNINEIFSNAYEELASQLSKTNNSVEYDGDLFDLCLNCESKIDVLKVLGFAKYSAYSKAIDIMFLQRSKYQK